jgi:hypothetical protein
MGKNSKMKLADRRDEPEKLSVRRAGAPDWQNSVGTYIAGSEHVDEMDLVAVEMERKWGVDRLRLLVPLDLREKFDRQRYLVNQAIWHGDLEAIKRETGRMVKAYRALDAAAQSAGKQPISADVWEIPLPDGTVAALVKTNAEAHKVVSEGRKVSVYTIDEIGRLIAGFPAIVKAKEVFEGAQITAVRTNITDPLQGVATSEFGLDDDVGEIFELMDIG